GRGSRRSSAPHSPFTRTWVCDTRRGVPVGVQVAWDSWSRTGCPPAFTRMAADENVAVTHGPLPAVGGGIEHPEIVHGGAWVTTGCPPTFTRGWVTVGCAC